MQWKLRQIDLTKFLKQSNSRPLTVCTPNKSEQRLNRQQEGKRIRHN